MPRHDGPAEAVPPRGSPLALRWFQRYTRRYLARHFHGIRIATDGLPPDTTGRPLVILMNHAAWWDPLVGLFLSAHFFTSRRISVPFDARALRKYRILQRMGAFPVEQNSLRGTRQFVRASRAILEQPNALLWITPHGRFLDVRDRHSPLQPGLAYLTKHVTQACFLPLAVEYVFWQERTPEILLRFGRPADPLPPEMGAHERNKSLLGSLHDTQDQLAALACSRDAASFQILLQGNVGVSRVYDTLRRFRAAVRGEWIHLGHEDR